MNRGKQGAAQHQEHRVFRNNRGHIRNSKNKTAEGAGSHVTPCQTQPELSHQSCAPLGDSSGPQCTSARRRRARVVMSEMVSTEVERLLEEEDGGGDGGFREKGILGSRNRLVFLPLPFEDAHSHACHILSADPKMPPSNCWLIAPQRGTNWRKNAGWPRAIRLPPRRLLIGGVIAPQSHFYIQRLGLIRINRRSVDQRALRLHRGVSIHPTGNCCQ